MIGREEAIEVLKRRLCVDRSDRRERLQVLTTVRGWPGVGKTTLAAALANDAGCLDRFHNGILWASLGRHPNVVSELRIWAAALGTEVRTEEIEKISRIVASLLHDKRMLLIVDDVWEVEHAIPFKVGGSGCAMLMTTRVTKIADALAPTPDDVYRLPELSEEAALELLQMLAPKTGDEYLKELKRLARELENLPLALQVAGRLLNAEHERGLSVINLLDELHQDAERLLRAPVPAEMADLVSQSSPSVAALLRKSTERLEPETRECFAYLGAFAPKPATFTLQAMESVWQIPEAKCRETVNELVDRGLLEAVERRHFWMHSLLVTYARSLCEE